MSNWQGIATGLPALLWWMVPKITGLRMKASSLALCSVLALFAAVAHAEPSLVIVVRHAEKATDPKDDPALSPRGERRAQQLAEVLADARVSAILTTQYRRTQLTAAPTAKHFGLTPTVITARREAPDAHVPEVLAAIKAHNGVVLVVGHSNTVPEIVAGLSHTRPKAMCEGCYSDFFVVSTSDDGAALVQSHYGATAP